MFKSRKSMAVMLVVGALVLAGGAAVAGSMQSAPVAAAAPAVPQVTAANGPRFDVAKYADLALRSFEGQLNIDDAQLDTAFAGAVSDTLDQLVKDGVITADQATQINAFVKDGVTGLVSKLKTFASRFGPGQSHVDADRPASNALSHASLLAKAKSMTATDRAKYADLFLTAFESRLGIDDAKLDAAFTATVSATVEQAVTDSILTSDQATRINDFAKLGVRQLASLASKFPFGAFGGARGLLGVLQPAEIASALGMNSADLEAQLKAGQTIAGIAAARHLDLTQVKQSILTQLRTGLDAAVKSGKLTQTIADQLYAKLSGSIDTLVTTPMFGRK